ncbi:alpha/beta fold hydrolase [Portibacter lacus]|uniref:Sigma factor SigB regulation protein RsbQ n=1 Tax=Portibacter lacus TaxID=1099794 RepID=A0AA37ST13_9BACT|nr:alpha/beta hydrolase [Portibacter lacus]GLR19868.1 sigma factor SigB regulation protein RsbQ [Portibacter lacus]
MKSVLKRNNVRIVGRGSQAIVFVHGFGCNQNMWRFVAPSFQDDYKVILLDLVGCGDSDSKAWSAEKYETLNAHAQDILEVCDELNLREHVIYIGHSVSSIIGVLTNNLRPNLFSKLILVVPSPCYVNKEGYKGGFDQEYMDDLLQQMEDDYEAWSNSLAPIIMGNPDSPLLSAELQASFCYTNFSIAKHFAKVTFLSDNREDVKQVKTPSLILQCEEDIIAPKYVGKYMHKQMANSTLKQLKVKGHCPHMSGPDETIEAIQNFLARQ